MWDLTTICFDSRFDVFLPTPAWFQRHSCNCKISQIYNLYLFFFKIQNLIGRGIKVLYLDFWTAALNGLTTSLIYHAAAQGIKIDEVESTLSGDLDLQGFLGMSEKVRNGYEKIRVNFKVKSDAPSEKIRELLDLAQKRSPVFDIVSNPTTVEVSLQE
jgi:uncharacterized OsmC-like protein